MTDYSSMLDVFTALFTLIAAGILIRFVPGIPAASDLRAAIGSMVLNVFLPALTFQSLATAPLSHELWMIPAIAITTALASAALSWLIVARMMGSRLRDAQIGALLLAATFCNATYLGLPVVTKVVGPEFARIPIVFDMLGMSPVLFTLGAWIGIRYGSTSQRLSVWRSLRSILTLPPFIAAVAGMLVNVAGLSLPPAVTTFTSMAGSVVAPVMLFSIGLALQVPRWSQAAMLTPSLVIKVIIAPLIAYGLSHLTPMSRDVELATVLEAAMPTMVLTMVFAQRYNLDTALLAQAILFSTVVSMITLPLIIRLW
jgi:hypothetical protein